MARKQTKRRWRAPAVAVFCVAAVAFFFYVTRLDEEVRARFAGARWALPAQVYAAPLELYPGLALSRDDLKRELMRLGYRAVKKADSPGTYAPGKSGSLDLVTRHFVFWDGPQAPTPLRLQFAGGAIADIVNPQTRKPSVLVRLDPLLIGSIFPAQQSEDRVLVKLDDVPPLLPSGLILVEDRSFEHHYGLDPKAILRASAANLLAGRVVQGGSTITQQLVKNFFLNSRRVWSRKINEALMALLLEAHYEKTEILEAYLNEVYLGQDGDRAVHGFGLASQFYFNKPLTELQAHEIALLVAMVKGPSYYNPRRHVERARERRDLVLNLFADAGYLDADEHKVALQKPIEVAGKSAQGAERYPAFVDLVRRQLKGYYADADLTGEGLRVFTTLDPTAQEILETRVTGGLARLEELHKIPPGDLQAAGVVTTVEGGQVLALVGGRDSRYAGFNRALDARRPIGSLAKPFVYLAALMQPQRFNLHSILEDEPIELESPPGTVWAPQNYDGVPHGPVPLYTALAESYNFSTVRIGLDLGVESVVATMQAAGYPGEPERLPSLFLGATDLSPFEVTQMYATLAAGGYLSPLRAIREVLTQDGLPLARYGVSVQQTLPEGPLYLLNWALEQVMIFGTGKSVSLYLPPALRLAGKTGTTDGLRDSWFAGYGADRVGVVWVGRDDNTPAQLSGAAGALQIWAPLMRDLKVNGLDPPLPEDVEEAMADPATGLRADENCPNAVALPYLRGHVPEEQAPCVQTRSRLRFLNNLFR